MSIQSNHQSEEIRSTHRPLSATPHPQAEALCQVENATHLSPIRLGAHNIGGRCNSPTRAATMLATQQTHGNRAVQRACRNNLSTFGEQVVRMPVQREGPDAQGVRQGPPGPDWEPIPGTRDMWGNSSSLQIERGPAHNAPPFENGPTDIDGNRMPEVSEGQGLISDYQNRAEDFISSKVAEIADWF